MALGPLSTSLYPSPSCISLCPSSSSFSPSRPSFAPSIRASSSRVRGGRSTLGSGVDSASPVSKQLGEDFPPARLNLTRHHFHRNRRRSLGTRRTRFPSAPLLPRSRHRRAGPSSRSRFRSFDAFARGRGDGAQDGQAYDFGRE